ncbi:MAG TPA: family 1 glycosylhydrolase [Terriglobales bacterium]|nr:family 1 glycosylhydrolase [Terriglobales bacterium]
MSLFDQSKSPPGDDLQFPSGFLWGVATAAHQVEGNNENQWTAWERAGKIKSGDLCGAACDWWNNAECDFDLAQELKINALRLSVEWSRVEPEQGRFDATALARYRQMLQGLHRRGIEPFVCLHHFSNPLWFEQQGGFLNPEAPSRFQQFTERVVAVLGDLCNRWVTFNEPNVYATLGYVTGEFPPGRKGEVGTALKVMTAMARAHALAYRTIHESHSQAEVGWAQHYVVFQPVGGVLDGWIAGIQSQIFNEGFFQLLENGRFSFPLSLGAQAVPEVRGACDFVGLNVYSRFHVTFDLKSAGQLFGRVFVPDEAPQGDCGMEKPFGEAFPGGIRNAVKRASRMEKPIYILENGVPDAKDRVRPWLIVNVVQEMYKLIQEGQPIRGYFHWTLTDNFEWAEGWNLRFGLVALDPVTQKRTLRPSAYLYREIIHRNGLSKEMIGQYPLPNSVSAPWQP